MRHEYGHHVAQSPPEHAVAAIDWGPKHWASAANVCARVSRREAFPGDEGSNYARNPGEAWAEAYRLMDERKAGDHDRDLADHRPELLPERGGLAGGRAGRAPAVDRSEHAVFDAGFGKRTAKVWWIPLADAARRRRSGSARRCRAAGRTRSRSSPPTGAPSSSARSGSGSASSAWTARSAGGARSSSASRRAGALGRVRVSVTTP